MQQPNPQQPSPQIVYVQQPRRGLSNGCLVFLLFGWIGLAMLWSWRLLKLTWKLLVTYPLKWTWAACVALWRWSVQGARWLNARYGWRGWAVVGAVVVVLAIISAVTGNH